MLQLSIFLFWIWLWWNEQEYDWQLWTNLFLNGQAIILLKIDQWNRKIYFRIIKIPLYLNNINWCHAFIMAAMLSDHGYHWKDIGLLLIKVQRQVRVILVKSVYFFWSCIIAIRCCLASDTGSVGNYIGVAFF